MVIRQLRALVMVIEIFKTKGTRLRKDQDALDCALASVVCKDLFEKKLGAATQRLLGASYAALKKACKNRETLERDGHWVVQKRQRRSDALSLRGEGLIRDWLHGDPDASKEWNDRKKPCQVLVGETLNGKALYELHTQRLMPGDKSMFWNCSKRVQRTPPFNGVRHANKGHGEIHPEALSREIQS